MAAVIERLDWDSDFLGMNVGRIRIENNEPPLLKDSGFDLVYVFSGNQLEPGQAEKLGLIPVDRKVTYTFNVNNYPGEPYDRGISSYLTDPVTDPVIIGLGLQSGIYSRFKLDQHFNPGTFERLYSLWMQRSIDREIADEVFVFTTGSHEHAGVITLALKPGITEIGIVAVDEKYRGKKIGEALVKAALNFAKVNNSSFVEVATQGENVPACLFYEKMGFTVKKTDHIYHFWNRH